MEWDIVVVGSVNTGYVVRGAELPTPGTTKNGARFFQGAGGKGANQAAAAARLGARTALIARGRGLIADVADEGVHVAHVSLDADAPTGATVIAAAALATTALGARRGLLRRNEMQSYMDRM